MGKSKCYLCCCLIKFTHWICRKGKFIDVWKSDIRVEILAGKSWPCFAPRKESTGIQMQMLKHPAGKLKNKWYRVKFRPETTVGNILTSYSSLLQIQAATFSDRSMRVKLVVNWFLLSQCTMRLSIELENFQILKSKGLVFAQFWSKYDNSSADWSKTGQNLKEKYSHHIFVQN